MVGLRWFVLVCLQISKSISAFEVQLFRSRAKNTEKIVVSTLSDRVVIRSCFVELIFVIGRDHKAEELFSIHDFCPHIF